MIPRAQLPHGPRCDMHNERLPCPMCTAARQRSQGLMHVLLDELPESTSCGCVGPQNGQPLCPCQMRGVQIQNGRYVRVVDLGPAPQPQS